MQFDIPFIGQIDNTEESNWIEAINSRAVNFRLRPLDSMQPDAMNKAEVAVVANPEPAKLNELPNIFCVFWYRYCQRNLSIYRSICSIDCFM